MTRSFSFIGRSTLTASYVSMTTRFNSCFLLVLLIPFLSFTGNAANPDALNGRWLSQKRRNQVQIYRQGNRYYGKIVWMLEPNDLASNQPKCDKFNPDASMRSRTLVGMNIMSDLQYTGENAWTGGQIYNPEDGRTYGCELSLRDANTMDVRAYMLGMKMIGKTITWTRVP